LAACIKGASINDLESINLRIDEIHFKPGELQSVKAAIWGRWAQLSPEEAIANFTKEDSHHKYSIQALVAGLHGRTNSTNFPESVPWMMRLGESIPENDRSIVYETMSQIQFSSPADFELLITQFKSLGKDGKVAKDDLRHYFYNLSNVAARRTPEYLLTSTSVVGLVSDIHLDKALFNIGKKDLDQALMNFAKIPEVVKQALDYSMLGFVDQMMDYDPQKFGRHLIEMSSGPSKDKAVAAMVEYLIKKEAVDQAVDWSTAIEDESLRKAVEKSIFLSRN
jgi:hypothetical protein